MSQPLRILFVEDLPTDQELAEWQLHAEGLEFISLRVETQDAFLHALDEFQPDLIISDYSMPEFDGMQALKLTQEMKRVIPFIVLTGSMNEDTAVECIKAGASDYVIKEHIHRLPFAVQEALKQQQTLIGKVQAEDALKREQYLMHTLMETVPDTIYFKDARGRFIRINHAQAKRLGVSDPEEAIGKTDFDFFAPEHAQPAAEDEEKIMRTGLPLINYEEILTYPDRPPEWVSATKMPLRDQKGEIAGTFGISRDITQRKLAEEETRHRLNELEVLYAASLAVGQLLQPKEIGQKIINILSERLHWHHTSIRQYRPESETLELLAFHQPGLENEAERLATEERIRTMIVRPGQGFAGWVIQHGQPVYCGDVTTDQRYIEIWPGIHSGLYVPLKVSERIIGCLSVESEQVNAFTEIDEWLITTLATQVASALENARLFEETSRRLKHVQALHAVDTAISSSLNLNVTLDVFLDQAVRLLGVDAADVLRFNPHTQFLEYVSGYGFRTNAIKHTRLRLGESYAGIAGLERRIIPIPHLDSRDTSLLRSPGFKSEGFETGFDVPLIAKGQLMGVLEIFQRSPLSPDQEWMQFLETLAGQAAIAIDNITLFDGLQRSNLNLSLAYDATIEGWSRALDLRDKDTEGHTQRVAELTMDLARALGLNEDQIIHIRRGALLHDIGKMGVPDEILHKPGSLSDDEWKIMHRHPIYAFEMLSPITYLRLALDIPYCHHEKWDGSGYPQGLKGEQIPLAARIFAVVDVYDALTSDRPYRKAWSKDKALQQLKIESGKHFEPQVVEAFLKMVDTG